MIRVYKRYCLDADSRQVILTKKVKLKKKNVNFEKGSEYDYKVLGYFLNVSDALYRIYQLEVNNFIQKNNTDFQEFLRFVKETEENLKDLVGIQLENNEANNEEKN